MSLWHHCVISHKRFDHQWRIKPEEHWLGRIHNRKDSKHLRQLLTFAKPQTCTTWSFNPPIPCSFLTHSGNHRTSTFPSRKSNLEPCKTSELNHDVLNMAIFLFHNRVKRGTPTISGAGKWFWIVPWSHPLARQELATIAIAALAGGFFYQRQKKRSTLQNVMSRLQKWFLIGSGIASTCHVMCSNI